MPAPSKWDEIERKYGKPMAAILGDLFAELRTESAVATELEVGQATINTWLLKLRLRKQIILVPDSPLSLQEGGEAQKASA
jgi:hypothetical protein